MEGGKKETEMQTEKREEDVAPHIMFVSVIVTSAALRSSYRWCPRQQSSLLCYTVIPGIGQIAGR